MSDKYEHACCAECSGYEHEHQCTECEAVIDCDDNFCSFCGESQHNPPPTTLRSRPKGMARTTFPDLLSDAYAKAMWDTATLPQLWNGLGKKRRR